MQALRLVTFPGIAFQGIFVLAFSHTRRHEVELSSTLYPHLKPPVALTIAGYDPSSGAGITADLQVFSAHGIFGISAITALTVQSTRGVLAVEPVSGTILRETLETLVSDLPPQGVKIGMLGSAEVVETVASFLSVSRRDDGVIPIIPLVLDPVLRSSSGAHLLAPEALEAFKERLLPLVDWITPNWSELALLTALPVTSMDEAKEAAAFLNAKHPVLNVIVTGGDQAQPADLFCALGRPPVELKGERVRTTSTHGTGCAFSTSFLSELILKKDPLDAARRAKTYVAEALRSAPGLGHGRGPMNLLWPLKVSR
jgi:hydroxymethylpyrimidine/phosphomethylpyrimidine kinase